MRKVAEERFRDLTNHYQWYRHKYGDVRYCMNCHKPLPKSENAPDFYTSLVGAWVEAKNADSSGSWNCSEIYEDGARKNQRAFLKKEKGWLFIDLTVERERHAFLIPWELWESLVEPLLLIKKMSSIAYETTHNKDGSIRRPGADELMKAFELEWKQTIGWTIPANHIWWGIMKNRLEEELRKVSELCQSPLIQTKFPNM